MFAVREGLALQRLSIASLDVTRSLAGLINVSHDARCFKGDRVTGVSTEECVIRTGTLPGRRAALVLAIVLVTACLPLVAQLTDIRRLRSLLACSACDPEFVRRELTYVGYLRERRDAYVHVLSTTLGDCSWRSNARDSIHRPGSLRRRHRHTFLGRPTRLRVTRGSERLTDSISVVPTYFA